MSKYWEDRIHEWIAMKDRRTDQLTEEISRAYELASADLEKDIRAWYETYAQNEEITLADAQRELTPQKLRQLKIGLERYIEMAKDNANGQWEKELTRASAAVHITRLEALQLEIRNLIRELYAAQEKMLRDHLADLYTDARQYMTYEIQQAQGIYEPFAQIPQKRIEVVLRQPWAADQQNFSSRIWTTQDKLIGAMQQELSRGLISGRDIGDTGTAISQMMGAARYAGVRLAQTEITRIITQSDADTYAEMGISQVEIIGTLDTHTCSTCGDLDGHVLKRKDVVAGVTAPPFHPNCRCVIAPYIKELAAGGSRAARDPKTDKTVNVAEINYKTWYNEYVKKTNQPTASGLWKVNDSGEIIKTRIEPEGSHYHTPTRGNPNEVIMHFGIRKQHDFDFYDSNGFIALQIHCGDHGNRKMHPYPFSGEHAADWTWKLVNGKWKPTVGENRELTEQERRWVYGDLKH